MLARLIGADSDVGGRRSVQEDPPLLLPEYKNPVSQAEVRPNRQDVLLMPSLCPAAQPQGRRPFTSAHLSLQELSVEPCHRQVT